MLRSTVFSLLFVFFSLVTIAQVMYKEHELDIIGDFRLSDNRQIYGVRIAYPILNLRSLNKVYHFPVQLYGGLDYTTGGVALGYSFGLRMAFFRSNLDKTLYAVQNVHLRTTDPTIDSFDKEEHLVAVGAGYKLQEQLAVEYLYGVNPYRATPIHNFAVVKTLRFQTTKRLKRKTQPLDCPPEQ